LLWLINSPVVEVVCFYDNCGTPVEIDGVASAKFANGTLASVAIGGSGVHWDNQIIIQTDKLVAKTAAHGGWLELTGPGGRRIYPRIDDPDHPASGTPVFNFVNALLGRQQLVLPVRYGVLLSVLLDAMYRSARENRIVHVDPVPEEPDDRG